MTCQQIRIYKSNHGHPVPSFWFYDFEFGVLFQIVCLNHNIIVFAPTFFCLKIGNRKQDLKKRRFGSEFVSCLHLITYFVVVGNSTENFPHIHILGCYIRLRDSRFKLSFGL
uniref:Uncharacterized protein n=1 Tax=Opuntia streptacantha TaxID=393608 RepID=A0A7C8YZ58_OPUST